MERTPTSIDGFDSLISGGFIRDSINLVIGAPGTGKTIFGLEFLHGGASKLDEKGIFVSFEQSNKELEEQAGQFGMDLAELQRKNKVKILFIPIEQIHKETLDLICRMVREFKAKRLVIDSVSTLSFCAPEITDRNKTSPEFMSRYFMYKFIYQLKQLSCTTLLTSELKQEDWLGTDLMAEFVVDTIVLLRYFGAAGESSRTLAIKKARRTKFNESIHTFRFTSKGITIEKPKRLGFVT